MEIFHQCFQYTPSNLSDFIECSFLLHFADKCEVIDRYMLCIMQNLQKNAQVSSLADLYIDLSHCVELTFF